MNKPLSKNFKNMDGNERKRFLKIWIAIEI